MTSMTLDRLTAILDAYGARAYRWPEAEREAALALLAVSPEARERRSHAAQLDEQLDLLVPPKADARLRQAALAKAPRPRRVFMPRLPLARAALAASLLLGIVTGGWIGREYQSPAAQASLDLMQATRLSSNFEDF